MKSLLTKWMSFPIVGLAIFFHADARGEDWKIFSVGSDGVFWSYDTQDVDYQPDNMIRVWVKKVKAEEIFKMIKSGTKIDRSQLERMISGREYETSLMEIRCHEKTANHLQRLSYDSKGILRGGESQPRTKRIIPPDSVAEKLYKIVCK